MSDAEKTNRKPLPEERLNAARKGTIKLFAPFTIGSENYDHLDYDFDTVKLQDYVGAMDSDQENMKLYQISNKQAVCLFAQACAVPMSIDPNDILDNLSTIDGVNARQKGTDFFIAVISVARKMLLNA